MYIYIYIRSYGLSDNESMSKIVSPIGNYSDLVTDIRDSVLYKI